MTWLDFVLEQASTQVKARDPLAIAGALTALVLALAYFVLFGAKSKAAATREVITKDRRSIEKYSGS